MLNPIHAKPTYRSMGCEHRSPLLEPVFTLLDLVGMHVELLGQFHQCLLASKGGKRHFCLESRAVVPA